MFSKINISNSSESLVYRADFGNAKTDLIKLNEKDLNLIFDIKYATKNNFTNKQIYKSPFVYIHKDLLPILKLASERANSLGYKIKIFDAWRPYEAQKALWDVVSDPRYVSDPDNGTCGHCRGMTIDLTLVDIKTSKELDMGTEFDSFEEKAHHTATNITSKQLKNRAILAGIMSSVGMTSFATEWWHYDFANAKYLYPKYKALDLGLDLVFDYSKK